MVGAASHSRGGQGKPGEARGGGPTRTPRSHRGCCCSAPYGSFLPGLAVWAAVSLPNTVLIPPAPAPGVSQKGPRWGCSCGGTRLPHLPAWGPRRLLLLGHLLGRGAQAARFLLWGPHLPLTLRPELSLLRGGSTAQSSRCLGGHGLQGGGTRAEGPSERLTLLPRPPHLPREALPFSASCRFGGGGLPPSLGLPRHQQGCLGVPWSSDRREPRLPQRLASSRS